MGVEAPPKRRCTGFLVIHYAGARVLLPQRTTDTALSHASPCACHAGAPFAHDASPVAPGFSVYAPENLDHTDDSLLPKKET